MEIVSRGSIAPLSRRGGGVEVALRGSRALLSREEMGWKSLRVEITRS